MTTFTSSPAACFGGRSAEEALADRNRFLAQLMTFGTLDDWQTGLRHWDEDAFRQALRHAPPGVFDPRSWAYWHHRLGLTPVPPLPTRRLPDAA